MLSFGLKTCILFILSLNLLIEEFSTDMNNNINPADFSILIVDDNATNTILLDAILKREKYKTMIARSGEMALQIMQEKHPDLVLLDIMMPEMDGYETALRKSEIESIRDIPFLFVTALSDTNNMVKGFKAGCSDFISKPFNTEEILIRIKHQLMSVADKRTIINQTEELRRLVNNRDKLYAVVAHDLRSPLGTIKTVLNMLDESLDSDSIGEDLKELLHATTDSSNELFSLLEDLLSWTKSQMGKLIFQPSKFVFSNAINDAIKAASSMANLHNITITHNDLTNQAEFIGDQKMVTTVARNILVNAIKFSEDDSSIEIESQCTDSGFSCSITDHGCGMNQEIQDALRDQIGITTLGKHQEEGTGLGLSLCREFIRAHKGSLDLVSEESKGSTFTFTLPI